MRLFDELKRRHVLRVAGVYIVAALGVLQGAQLILPTIAPAWVYNVLVILALLGLPVTIALAWAFDVTPEGVARTPSTPSTQSRPFAPSPLIVAAFALLAVVGLTITGFLVKRHRQPVDTNVVAVLPFRVSGDPGLRYLREGMLELVNARLSDVPHAIEARTLLSAWRNSVRDTTSDMNEKEGVKFARTLGAGRVLLGSIVATGSHVTLTATLLRSDGRRAESGPIEGSVDSITVLTDRMLAAVLGLDAGEKSQTVASLMSTSFPAVRAYLLGRSFDRRGRFSQAVEHYNEALQLDSTFALAALNNVEAAEMLLGARVRPDPRSSRLAWDFRDRLSSDDRAYVEARRGTPGETTRQQIERWERVTQQLPDRPEAWYHLGDLQLHMGSLAGYVDHIERAEAAFKRSIELDSLYATPLMHLEWLSAWRGDSAGVVNYLRRFLAIESTGPLADLMRRDLMIVNRDVAALQAWSDSMPLRVSTEMLLPFVLGDAAAAPKELRGMTDALRAADILVSTATTSADRNTAHTVAANIALNAGLRARAVEHRAANGTSGFATMIYDALFWDGDSIAARNAVRTVEEAHDSVPNAERARRLFGLELWRLTHGDRTRLAASIAELRALPDTTITAIRRNRVAVDLLNAFVATLDKKPDAFKQTLAVDSIVRQGISMPLGSNLLLARMFEMQGRDKEALDAARRFDYNVGAMLFRTTHFRERARLAAKLGFTEEAKRYYRQYLIMRANPDPSLIPERDRIRKELRPLIHD